jgi:hypothetical protein
MVTPLRDLCLEGGGKGIPTLLDVGEGVEVS